MAELKKIRYVIVKGQQTLKVKSLKTMLPFYNYSLYKPFMAVISKQLPPLVAEYCLLTLSAHAQEGYTTYFVYLCVCVCLSVTTLAAALFISTIKQQYERLQFSIFFIFNSWIFKKLLRSHFMVSLAYCKRILQFCSYACFVLL